MAGVKRVWSGVQRVEFFAAGEGHDEIRQEKEDADGGDVFVDSRHGFCGQDGEEHFCRC
jgi:hypothetical protein